MTSNIINQNIGLVVCEEEAENYLKKLAKISGYSVRALWTPNCEQSFQLAAQHDVPFAANKPDEVVLRKDVQMLIIDCRPTLKTHVALSALGIGKHVLCTNPMALTKSEALSLLEASQYYPQLYALVAYGFRSCSDFQSIKFAIKQGLLGHPLVCQVNMKINNPTKRVYNWTCERETGGGILNLYGSHLIDALNFMLDEKIRRIQSLVYKINESTFNDSSDKFTTEEIDYRFIHRKSCNSEDFVSFLARCQNGSSITATLQETIIVNSEHIIDNDPISIELNISGPKGRILYKDGYLEINNENRSKSIDKNTVVLPCIADRSSEILIDLCEKLKSINFRCKLDNVDELAQFSDVFYVRSVIDSILKSNSTGSWTEIDSMNSNLV